MSFTSGVCGHFSRIDWARWRTEVSAGRVGDLDGALLPCRAFLRPLKPRATAQRRHTLCALSHQLEPKCSLVLSRGLGGVYSAACESKQECR